MSLLEILGLVDPQRDAAEALTNQTVARVDVIFNHYANTRYPTPGNINRYHSQAASDLSQLWSRGSRAAGTLGRSGAVQMLSLAGLEVRGTAPDMSGLIDQLTADLERNLDTLDSALLTEGIDTEKAVRQARFRSRLATSTLVQRSVLAGQLATYAQAERDHGVLIRKMWVANIVHGDPCPACRRLHGRQVHISEEFSHAGEPPVWRDLHGPPRHPNCQCVIVPYVVTLEQPSEPEQLDPEDPPELEADLFDSEEVRAMKPSVFESITAVLQSILKRFRRRRG